MAREAEWTESDSKDNATATATHALEAGARHCITKVIASFGAAAAGKLLQIKKGAVVAAEYFIHNADEIDFSDSPLRGNAGEAVSAVLVASGTGGVLGKVTMFGYTEG